MRYFLMFCFIVGAFWLAIFAVQNSADITINYQWNDNPMSVSLTSTTLLIVGIVGLVGLYFLLSILKFIFSLGKRIKSRRQRKLALKAKNELTKGLVLFTEGNWEESEHLLINNVDASETPLLNYLAASRSAHMQEAYDRRDNYLKVASEQGEEAQIAVAVSQAEMQFTSDQLEQSRATLIRLLEVSPKHPYALKLLAKVYFQQEDWNNLFTLLPDLDNLSLINKKDSKKYQKTALTGIFHSLARKKDIKNLKILWKKLPGNLRDSTDALLLYSTAMSEAGDLEESNKLLIEALNKNPNEKLFERYGLIEHENQANAIKEAERWLLDNSKSPMLLLALARLHRKHQLWGKSKSYYNASLNFSPSASVYLELAELLEELSEHENAEMCYKLGLEYSIRKKGQILNLKSLRSVDNSKSRSRRPA